MDSAGSAGASLGLGRLHFRGGVTDGGLSWGCLQIYRAGHGVKDAFFLHMFFPGAVVNKDDD